MLFKKEKKSIVIHSGGMDSSICLAVAIRQHGRDSVLSLSFSYGQRHQKELTCAEKICRDWGVQHAVIHLECLQEITANALMDKNLVIEHEKGKEPNTLVVGRNGLMARIGAIHAHHIGARSIYMGVMGAEGAHSGYRDCSREYIDIVQQALRIDLDDPHFEIVTPLVAMSKKESLELAQNLGVLSFLLENAISCYEGIIGKGCRRCPACQLRNEGIRQFMLEHPEFVLPDSF